MPPLNDRENYKNSDVGKVIFSDHFDHPDLDAGKWFPYYLPHWSSLDLAAAQFSISDSMLRLTIRDDQRVWSSEYCGQLKVSGLQTGHFSGEVGSGEGQHRFCKGLKVHQESSEARLFLPRYCRLEMKARAKLNPWNLAALWLIGFEDSPEKSGEITIFEAFGDKIGPSASSIGMGIKRIHDPNLYDDVMDATLPIDVEHWHVYAMDWTPAGVDFYVDGNRVTTTTQSPAYPMQIMVNLYELPHSKARAGEQTWFDIDYIIAFRNSDEV